MTVAALGVALIAVVTAWIGVRAAVAYVHIREAEEAAASVLDRLHDPAEAASAMAEVSRKTAIARDLTSDPLWRAVEEVPGIGPQLRAARALTASVDDLMRTAAAPFVARTAEHLAGLWSSGAIDLERLAALGVSAADASDRIERASAALDGAERGPLLPPLSRAMDAAAARMDAIRNAADLVARAGELLPALLGADGPRHYLLLFQNNAEWRSLGGIPGAMALVRAEAGTIELVGQESTNDFRRFRQPVLELADDVVAIYGQGPGRWIQNITQVPDFAVTGAIAQEMWAREHAGQRVDGVISFDPVALSYLLDASGPLTTAGGEVLHASTVVDVLLSDSYRRFGEQDSQDAFFADAAAAVFASVTTGDVDLARMTRALAQAAEERRLLLWSARADESALIANAGLAGGLPRTDAETARFGVFLNDGTGSKMDFYQTASSEVQWLSCRREADGTATGTARIEVTIENDAPDDVESLSPYITSGGRYGLEPGTVRTVTYVYLPRGFDLDDAEVTGDAGFGGGEHDGHRVVSAAVDLVAGESATIAVTATTRVPSASSLDVVSTPIIGGMAVENDDCGS